MDRAKEISKLHSEICGELRTTVQKAIRIGELLVEQKKECGHGRWYPWLEANVKFSTKTAWQYMRCYERRSQILPEGKISSIVDIARVTAKPTEEEKKESELVKKAARDKIKKAEDEMKEAILKKQLEDEKLQAIRDLEAKEVEVEFIEEEFIPFEYSEEEIERKCREAKQAVVDIMQSRKEDETKEARKMFNSAEEYWNSLDMAPAWKVRYARIFFQFLYKKYPKLMDEPIGVK